MKKETATQPRTRKRQLDVLETKPTDAMKEIAQMVYTLNKQFNAAKLKHDKLRKELHAKMKEHGVTHLDLSVVLEGITIPLVADLVTPMGQAVDSRKLQTLVPMDKFLEMATVSQKAVTDVVGGAILNQVLVSVTGTEAVNVKAAS